VRVAADNAFAGGDMKTAISLLSRLIELEPSNERNFYKVRGGGSAAWDRSWEVGYSFSVCVCVT
jgi:hypothetical protein